jgi:photosystem II stability/assembly factor-like uncharacterized protein
LDLYVRSVDGGATWVLPEYRIENLSKEEFARKIGRNDSYHLQVFIVAIHPARPLTLFAGIKVVPWLEAEGDKRGSELEAVYTSTDGGDHWSEFSGALAPFGVHGEALPLGISPRDPQIYFAMGKMGKLEGVTVKGIVKSIDGGRTWSAVGQQLELMRPAHVQGVDPRLPSATTPEVHLFQFAFDNKDVNTTYLVSSKGVFMTSDGGKTWRLLDLGFDELDAISSMAVSPLNSGQLFVGSRYGAFRSDDGGCSFRKIFPVGAARNLMIPRAF